MGKGNWMTKAVGGTGLERSKTRRRRGIAAVAVVTMISGIAAVLAADVAEAARPMASATLHDAAGAEIGRVVFKGRDGMASSVEVRLRAPAAPGLGDYHGLHVHTVGQCAPPFTSAGGHWNPTGTSHGHHAGDLPSVLVGPDGTGFSKFATHRIDINALLDLDGSAVVLHAGPDNFANVPIAPDRYQDPNGWYNAPGGSAATGDAGGRYACGVVRPGSGEDTD